MNNKDWFDLISFTEADYETQAVSSLFSLVGFWPSLCPVFAFLIILKPDTPPPPTHPPLHTL